MWKSISYEDWLTRVSVETARMSYPTSMSRGTVPLVIGNTKKALEKYFDESGFVKNLLELQKGGPKQEQYDEWHTKRICEIGDLLVSKKLLCDAKTKFGVGAKFVDTYMHQLMKFEMCRSFWKLLFLPIDRKVCRFLNKSKDVFSQRVQVIVDKYKNESPYFITEEEYSEIQKSLWIIIDEINKNLNEKYTLTSRIELNCIMWAID
jgi:hypothetical protein